MRQIMAHVSIFNFNLNKVITEFFFMKVGTKLILKVYTPVKSKHDC